MNILTKTDKYTLETLCSAEMNKVTKQIDNALETIITQAYDLGLKQNRIYRDLVQIISLNVDNDQLSAKDFRIFVRNSLPQSKETDKVTNDDLKALENMVRYLGQSNGIRMIPVKDWPTVFDYKLLNEQAARLTEEEMHIYVDGDQDEADILMVDRDCLFLSLFLDSIFDGKLRDSFFVKD